MYSPSDAVSTGEAVHETPAEAFRRVRGLTERLSAPLSPEDCVLQSMTEASPVKWQLAHTTWFFETFVLEAAEPGYVPADPAYRVLFNSYYNSVGEQHPRSRRGMLSRPSLAAVRDYRNRIDERMLALIESGRIDELELGSVVELGIHHEQQHQELILTDVKHALSQSPLRGRYHSLPETPESRTRSGGWIDGPSGLVEIGRAGRGFAFDNEGPRHAVHLGPFELAARPVTNAEYLAFMEDGGYEQPELWLADGWTAVHERGWRAPLYWERIDGIWRTYTLGGMRDLRPDEPVTHLSYYEADAYAAWTGARLPSEAEWEAVAAAEGGTPGRFVEDGFLHPAPAPESGADPRQMLGDVWEWTQSPYTPYPGFRAPAGALGEYNGKFMANQIVLRGGSCATSRTHIRSTYRNFFYPDARWQFSGIRLARDA
jgi:ergothioneine biosynthesis protein EgtB